eukprot:2387511-Prymnesium_polylepis.1
MECRLMQRTAMEHSRLERVLEADKAGYFTTVHNFYQPQDAPTVERRMSHAGSQICSPQVDGKRKQCEPGQTALSAE